MSDKHKKIFSPSFLRALATQVSVVLLLLVTAFSAHAQIELSSGIDINYPLLINGNNSKLNYGQLGFGIRFGVAYKPPETQFFPIINTSFGRIRLPLKQFGKNVTVLNFDCLNMMLNENFVAKFTNSELFIYGGIGFSYLNKKGIMIAGPGGESKKVVIDSTTDLSKVFPAINIGFEYNYGESAGKDLYLTMGLNFQYILLLSERNNYYIRFSEPGATAKAYKASLSGNAISPCFYIAIHYLLHTHKKSSMYLK